MSSHSNVYYIIILIPNKSRTHRTHFRNKSYSNCLHTILYNAINWQTNWSLNFLKHGFIHLWLLNYQAFLCFGKLRWTNFQLLTWVLATNSIYHFGGAVNRGLLPYHGIYTLVTFQSVKYSINKPAEIECIATVFPLKIDKSMNISINWYFYKNQLFSTVFLILVKFYPAMLVIFIRKQYHFDLKHHLIFTGFHRK